MKRLTLLFLFPALASAQDTIARGAEVFAKTCATGYCHAAKGSSGGSAPRLVARGFIDDYISQTITRGIPGTAMPAFGNVLPRQELAAVIAYVDSLNGVTPRRNPALEAEPEKKLPPEAERGRELFFDAQRGFARCATCHQVAGFGIPVASPIARIPADAAALRGLATSNVETATAGGESFPALVLSQGKNIKLYDLTSPPPVLRTFASASVTLKEGSSWRHGSVVAAYNDAEFQAILTFLRAVAGP